MVWHPGTSFDSKWPVVVRGINLNYYSYEEVLLSFDLIANLLHLLLNVCAAHCSSLVHLFCRHQFDWAHGEMTSTFSSVRKPDVRTLSEAFEKAAGC